MKSELIPANGDPPIPIHRDVTILGRREYCDVKIDHASLSKRHCVLVRTDGLLIVRDLASTNGTKVNGQRVRWAALLPNDRVSIGRYKVRVYLGPDTAPAPSEVAARAASRPPAAGLAAPAPEPVITITPEDIEEDAPDDRHWRGQPASDAQPVILLDELGAIRDGFLAWESVSSSGFGRERLPLECRNPAALL